MTIKEIVSKPILFALYLISEILFFLSFKNIAQKRQILLLKGKYHGQRCFIIGNGPSLRAEDLEKLLLNNEISFASNNINKIFSKTSWRPTYYSVMDEWYQRKIINVMSETPAQIKFFRKKSYLWTRKVHGNCIYLDAKGGRKYLNHPLFSDNILKQIYAVATVTYFLIQIAVYMGFIEIYLIGTDNIYAKIQNRDGSVQKNEGINSYFYDNINKQNVIGYPWEANIVYETAKQYADTHGIKIINATRGGQLEIFSRIDFDTLFTPK
jgi:hypothetical protein